MIERRIISALLQYFHFIVLEYNKYMFLAHSLPVLNAPYDT
jgi:hypothetical protein